MVMNMSNIKELKPKIVFRYEEELMTLFNKGTKRFVKSLWFVLLIIIVAFFFLDRNALIDNFIYFVAAIAVAIIFTVFIYRRTLIFQTKVKNFANNGIKLNGKIVGTKVDSRSKRNTLHLIVEYVDPEDKQKKTFVTDAVTGNPYTLLHSMDVTVYKVRDNCFATDFNLKVDLDKK